MPFKKKKTNIKEDEMSDEIEEEYPVEEVEEPVEPEVGTAKVGEPVGDVADEIQRAIDKALTQGGSREEQIDAAIVALQELKNPTPGIGGLGGETLNLGEEEIM